MRAIRCTWPARLSAGLIPAVWIPPQDVRELRALVAHHTRLIRQRTQAKNRLRSTLHRYNIVPPAGGLFAAAQRSWWEALALSAVEKLRIRQDLSVLASLEPLIAEVEVELTRLSGTEPWLSQVVFLLQVPGIGMINALVRLPAIGDITRFPTAKQLVGYAGLGASVHACCPNLPDWTYHPARAQGNAGGPGGIRLDGSRAPPLLESAL
jgi:transposase